MNLNQVTIPSLDLSLAIPFYEKLGLRLIVSANNQYARFECPNGDSTFSIHKVDELQKGPGIYVYFECEDLDILVPKLESKGIHFVEQPSDRRWLWREARLNDLDGNQIILYWAGDNRKNPPWRIQDGTSVD